MNLDHNKSLRILLLIMILILSAYFRLIGLDWDQSQHLHPDERFMTMVVSALDPTDTLADYFNTATSTLNPNNRGFSFYVYGDLPIILVRYAADWMDQLVKSLNDIGMAGNLSSPDLLWILGRANWAGYDEVALLGRVFSALFDLASLIFVYLIAKRLFSAKVGLLAAFLAGSTVMLIQQAHFFTVDSTANFFMTLTVFFAVELIFADLGQITNALKLGIKQAASLIFKSQIFWLVIGFGFAFGSAMACKVNAAPLAFLLPAVFLYRYLTGTLGEESNSEKSIWTAIFLTLVGGVVSILVFRITMPYAFSGPGFFKFSLNESWIKTIQEQRLQASGDVDFPPALQWAKRSLFYSGTNLLLWGAGIPLGLAALFGFLGLGWQIFVKQAHRTSLLLWGWVGFYFLWQSAQWNPTMRYQLPIYPFIAIFAAWFILNGEQIIGREKLKLVFRGFGAIVLVLSLLWAYAFTRIYTVDHTRVQATRWIFQNVPGAINFEIKTSSDEVVNSPHSIPPGFVISNGLSYDSSFRIRTDGQLSQISFAHVANLAGEREIEFQAEVFRDGNFTELLSRGNTVINPTRDENQKGESASIVLEPALEVKTDEIYFLRLSSTNALAIIGSAPIHESSWDDGLPLRMDGYDPYAGIYLGDLNFEMYWQDDQAKFERFVNNLNAGDFIFISSNRQWATTTRLPERYPLTSHYYRELLGCPAEMEILECYNIAEPGMFSGNLGFELVKTFTSYPNIFDIEFNTQFADEAFTVYDAPKVLIFEKSSDYSAEKVEELLASVDLSKVIHVTPRKAAESPGDLMMSEANQARNTEGGTWSSLFSYESFLNQNPVLGLIAWYGFITLLGVFTWPILFGLFRGSLDRGYAAARLAGLLFSAYLGWLLSSLGLSHDRSLLWAIYAVLALAGIMFFLRQKEEIFLFVKQNRSTLLLIEAIFLILFAFDFVIRLSNPDLWHPYRGGERPMDFSFLNAVIKSTVFPPYDPWMAGGYINYYYYGFVIVSIPIKALGIVPSIAYNFILPTLFATVGVMGASLVWNIALWKQTRTVGGMIMAGTAGAAGMILIGNLGTFQLIFRSLQKLAMPNEMVDATNVLIFTRWGWAFQGLAKLFQGQKLPIGIGDYYWAPSRVMPIGDMAITEFPLFTFLYSDLHAHMISLPITLFVILWVVLLLRSGKTTLIWWLSMLTLGGFLVGTLKPTNTWDYPTYLILSLVTVAYVILGARLSLDRGQSWLEGWRKWIFLGSSLLFVFLIGGVFYAPFDQWYGLGYSEIEIWKNEKTPIWSLLTHWGLFLFVIIFWMGKTTVDWMAATPASALNKLRPYRKLIVTGLVIFIMLILVAQIVMKVTLAWFLLLLAIWVLILLLRPGVSDEEKLVLFLIGTALMLNLMVELIVLSGDIGRMNTVFKFYYQAWTLFAISSGAILVWVFKDYAKIKQGWRLVFELGFLFLLGGTLLFTVTATLDKARDRISEKTEFTYDSMTFMKTATYWDKEEFSLAEDYAGIRWMQENVAGSPVIIEANTPEYRWGSRYSIYTGLPGVVGWNWHMRQQRAITPSTWVTERVDQVTDFYQTENVDGALAMIRKYDIRYIIVGDLERIYYQPNGLAKFENFDGVYWKKVFQEGDSIIYEVIP